jgi:hypothetical protein
MMRLSIDKALEVENNTLGLVALAHKSRVGVLERADFLLVALPLPLELLGNFLLEDESLEGVVALFLGPGQTMSKTSRIVLLLVDKRGEPAVLPLVVLDLDLELVGFLGELLGKRLEFEELQRWVSINLAMFLKVPRHTCCFQVSSSSTRKLFRLVTLDSSVSMRPLRLIKSCQASRASLEYWLRSRTTSLRCLMETLVMSGFFTEPPKMALRPVLRP